MIKRLSYISFFLLAILNVAADNPWKQIETEHYKIIFRESYTSDAQFVANLLEKSVSENYSITGQKPARKWTVVLTSDSMVPNGYVALAPARSVWYETPVQSFYGDWYAALASHETRHMAQMDSQRQGLWLLFYAAGGEAGELAHFLAYPFWFIEGDAVWNETVLSDKGRGRDPAFSALFRALAIEEKPSYSLMVNRSYKKNIPNHYVLGYHLVSYIRDTYGEEKVKKIIRDASFFPFANLETAIKKNTGKNIQQIYQDMIEEYSKLWQQQIEKQPDKKGKLILQDEKEDFISYSQIYLRDDILYTESYSLDRASSIDAYHPDGNKKTIIRLSSPFESAISENYIYWLEYDATNSAEKNYSDIHRLNLKTNKKEKLTHKEKFFNIACNSKGDMTAVSRMRDDHRAQIQLFYDRDGDFTDAPFFSYTLPPGIMPSYLAVDESGERIAIAASSIAGSSLIVLDVKSAELRTIIPDSAVSIRNPVFYNDGILFSANFKGYSAIFVALDTDYSNGVYLVATGKYMAHHPYVRDGVLYYADFLSPRGDVIRKMALNPDKWVPLSELKDIGIVCAKRPENISPVFSSDKLKSLEIKQYPVTDYSLIANAVNFHSWLVLPADMSNPGDNYSIFKSASLSLFSDDVMGTTSMMLSGAYNFYTSAIRGMWGLIFSPYLTLSGIYEYSADFSFYSEHAVKFSLPFNFSNSVLQSNSVSSSLVPSVTAAAKGLDDKYLFALRYSLDYSYLFNGSVRDVFPIAGFSATASIDTYPSLAFSDSVARESLAIFLPGGIAHSSLQLSFSSAQSEASYLNYYLVYGIAAPSVAKNIFTSRVYYDFPLFYVDWGISPVFFLKRLRLAGFSDFGSYNLSSVLPSFSFSHFSAGFGVVSDFSVADLPAGALSVTTGVFWKGELGGSPSPYFWFDFAILEK